MFIDKITVDLVAGNGGNGVVAWRREKYIPKGGPCGGNGGKGGSIIFQADTQLFCLSHLRNRAILKAENGGAGGSNLRQGKNGTDLIIKVPCGTLLKDAETGEILHDFTQNQEKVIVCKGGKGGRGNDSFKTPTNRAPNQFTEGKEGESLRVALELKLIADIGLIGFPNAGKSTLINALAHVKVKIAAYPFTTLQPNIGFIETEDYRRIFIADIPGIIEGAHRNKGLGFEFLKHIERTKLLVYVLDCSGIDGRTPLDDFKILRQEMGTYNTELLERPYLIALNKIDSEDATGHLEAFYTAFPEEKNQCQEISALTGLNLPAFSSRMIAKI